MCDTPIDVVERALLDPGAEIVLILAKVAGLSAATTKAILLLRAADRGMSAKDLDQALTSFNRLQQDTALRVLSFFRTRAKKPAPTGRYAASRGQRLAPRRNGGRPSDQGSNSLAALAATRHSGSGNSNRPATHNIPVARSVVLPPR